jgi:uncharacterized membrane protein YqjE
VSASVPPPGGEPSRVGRRSEQPQNIATAITEVSERATVLVREEIELAKAEVLEKGLKLAKGAVVGVVAGIFFATAILFLLVGCAWLLYYYLPGNDFTYFWGFFAMAVILVVLGAIAGLVAARVVKRGAPPTPDMAIEEYHRIRDDVAPPAPGPAPGNGSAPVPAADAATVPPVPAPVAASAPEPEADGQEGER